jgi:ATP-dependent helicase HrpA
MTGVDIPYDAWQEKNLPDYLFFNYRVIAADGKQLKESRDLASLQTSLNDFVDESPPSQQTHALEQDNVDASALDELPEQVEVKNHGIITNAYPALSVDDKQVNLRIFYSADEARASHFAGLRQLFINALSQPLRHIKSGMKNIQLLCAQYAPVGSCEHMKSQLIHRVIDQLFTHHLPRQQSEFQHLLDLHRSDISPLLDQLLSQLGEILKIYHSLQKQLKRPPLAWLDAMADIQDQLNHLLHRDFILSTEREHFDNLARYLRGIEKRLQKIQDNPQRDRTARLEISHLWDEYKKRAEVLRKNNRHSNQLEAYRWMLEEYRISLFAQEIKTRYPVSAKRLKKAWNEISDA